MKNSKRYLFDQIKKDLKNKMVFVSGPRQVGKTTLSQFFLKDSIKGYLNWDIPSHKEQIIRGNLPHSDILIFDEIHKYRQWRQFLKGVYDQLGEKVQILVTGSARLDTYRWGGDSLQGRYHALRLPPLSVAELKLSTQLEFNELINLGGYPEPYFSGDPIFAQRWSREYRSRVIEEDLVSLENVVDLSKLHQLSIRLPDLVASPLSINSLREDLDSSHKAVSHWVSIFVNLFSIFLLSPFGAPSIRAVKKEQKHYHFDWTLVDNLGARFENVIAVHLLKWIHFEQDTKGRNLELGYFRDVDGREVDFVISEKLVPILAIEVKLSDTTISKSLRYFKKKFPDCRCVQLVNKEIDSFVSKENINVYSAVEFLNQFI